MLAILAVIVFSVQINFPHWLLHCAQFVIGATLGAQFSGVNKRMLKRSLRLGAVAVGFWPGRVDRQWGRKKVRA